MRGGKFLLALLGVPALIYYIATNTFYIKNYFAGSDVIGKRVKPLVSYVAYDITKVREGYMRCPTPGGFSNLVGLFASQGAQGLPLLNESDPSFSKEECTVVESYACVAGFIQGIFSPGHKGYVVDCNGSHVILKKGQVDNNFGLSYVNKNVEDKAVIGERVRPSKGSRAIDYEYVPAETMKNKIGCPTTEDYSNLKGYFSRSIHNYNLGQDLGPRLRGPVLDESDPSFSNVECKIVESFECVPAENRFGIAMSDEGYVVDCGGVHIVLPKNNAFLEDE